MKNLLVFAAASVLATVGVGAIVDCNSNTAAQVGERESVQVVEKQA